MSMFGGRRRRLVGIGLSTMLNSISVLLLQVLALLALIPADFGRFSAVYLIFGLSTSFLLSVVCEAWQRTRPHSSWGSYGAMLVWMSLTAGFVTGTVCLVVGSLRPLALPSVIAVVFATYRTGARYYSMQFGEKKYVLFGDLGSILVLGGAWFWIFLAGQASSRLVSVSWAWALSSMASALLSRRATAVRVQVIREWMTQHGHEVRTLLADSMILDAAGIGVPYALIPLLSISGFGTYRALSNFSGPVKLMLFPLRPLFSKRDIHWFAQPKVVAAIFAAGSIIGAAGGAALVLLQRGAIEVGTLTSLSHFWLLAGVFVAATFVNGVYYLIGRTHFTRRVLLTGRLTSTILGIVLPVVGALVGELKGAMIGATLCVTLVAFVWIYLLWCASRQIAR